ncbi:MAG TPA: M55 family metallopeptidase [Streptosporangiaceae bacterium]|nr:M55 family metallopeptidase [Streptosporangiaceae bacterium]
MQVYITADMEGITGLVDAIDVQPGGADYERGRVMMTEDVNAAIRGALAAGASRIVVNDAHGPLRNLLPDQLHPAARLVRGRPKPMSMIEGLDDSFDAALCVGYHAKAGTLGVLSHSFMGHEIEDMWLDDDPVGEIGLVHATAAAAGVPVVLLTGDDAACTEMTDWDPGVRTVAVKTAHGRFAADLLPVAAAREAIETGAREALQAAAGSIAGASPAAPAPRARRAPGEQATLAVRWQSADVAALLLGIPGVRLRDSRTVEASGTLPALFRLFGLFIRVAVPLGGQAPYC